MTTQSKTDALTDGDLDKIVRLLDAKVNRLLGILRTKNVISEGDLTELANLVVFPK